MMNTFPLIRVKWSNEHVMAAVFGVLVLYMLPSWLQNLPGFLEFLAVLIFSLIIDTTANIIRFKRPVCAVSAAVTAAILYVLTPGVSLWGQLLGAAAALLVGKHIWGGTGKNPINPAMVGLLFISLFFKIKEPAFTATLMLLPALVLSVPFIKFRPFAAFGFMAGMVAALIYMQEFSFEAFIAYGIIFWGCLILTDPVTITVNPFIGAVGGVITGFFALRLSGSALVMATGVLVFNILSVAADRFGKSPNVRRPGYIRVKKIIPFQSGTIPFYDLTKNKAEKIEDISLLDREEILRRIEVNEVFGFGGAAFPTIEKIRAVIESRESRKHLIINGVECDPGLIHDHWLMCSHMNEICTGIKILTKCVKFESVTLAVKESADISCAEGVKVYRVPDYYPAGAERFLIRQVLGKKLSRQVIPAKEGILVLNVQTLYAIYEAVCKNKKTDTRLITIADMKGKSGYVVKVRLGTNIQRVIDALVLKAGHAFLGGGAMQCRNAADDDVIDKTVNFMAIGDFPRYKESPLCSRCGFCKSNCPAGIMVDRIAELVDEGDLKGAKRYKPETCIQCGNCSRVCLAGRNLAARVKAANLNHFILAK